MFQELQVRIWLCAPPTEMRKSLDGLLALAYGPRLVEHPLSGHLLVSTDCRRTHLWTLNVDRAGD